MTEGQNLFVTEVGSRMWGMATPESDYDHVVVYQVPTRRILEGHRIPETRSTRQFVDEQGREMDIAYKEVGHLVAQLIKGNVNNLWTVTSPVVVEPSPVLDALSSLARKTVSRASYHSIMGMAQSQYADAVKRAAVRSPQKNLATAYRTVRFGITLFETGRIEYRPVLWVVEEREVQTAFTDLVAARDASNLPDTPDEEPFRALLMTLRLRQLSQEPPI